MTMIREAILDPIQALEKLKPKLFEIYQKDYAQKDTAELEKRWNNTIFITDPTPKEEKKFISYYGAKGYNMKKRLHLDAEWLDYDRQEKTFQKEAEENFAEYVKRNYRIPADCSAKTLWNMDFGAYAYTCENKRRKRRYALECLENGFDKITNEDQIADILRKKEQLKEKMHIQLMNQTRWGKRMQQKYSEIPAEVLANIFYDEDTTSATCMVLCNNGKKKTVCFLPLMRHISMPSLDRLVFHELRHVVETTEEKSGLSVFKMPKYDMINEMRTERNAKKDALRIPVFFSRGKERIQSYYELLLPAIPELREREEEMNQIAFQDNKEMIDECLGEELDQLMDAVYSEEQILRKIRRA